MTQFFTHFFISNISISFSLLLLIFVRFMFRKQLTCNGRYNTIYIVLFLLVIPFIPVNNSFIFQAIGFIRSLFNRSTSAANTVTPVPINTSPSSNGNWMNDFAISVNSTSTIYPKLLFIIWLAGVYIFSIRLIVSGISLYKLKKSAVPVTDDTVILNIYSECLELCNVRRYKPKLYSSSALSGAVIVGVFRPVIYIPRQINDCISDYTITDLRHILLHELQHFKRRDNAVNMFICIFCILYWFNPVVIYTLHTARHDREKACDNDVLQYLGQSYAVKYGQTILRAAASRSSNSSSVSFKSKSRKKLLKTRLQLIVDFKPVTKIEKRKCIYAFFIIILLMTVCAPLSVYALDDTQYKDFAPVNLESLDLSSYFSGYNGCFVLYDKGNDKWFIYNQDRALCRTSPDSTYKIYDAVMALEHGIITSDNSFMRWDGSTYPFDAWNTDQTLRSAMTGSVNWYFDNLDAAMDHTDVKNFLSLIEYGNQNINSAQNCYWLESSLTISPVEQVELLCHLKKNDWNLSKANVDTVMESMFIASSDGKSLYGKTGTGRIDDVNINGWFVGFITSNDNDYFFATNISLSENDNQFLSADGLSALKISLSILRDLGIYAYGYQSE